jgi:hypothetical protein
MLKALQANRVVLTKRRRAGHSNARATGLYVRHNDDISVREVERIGI